MFYIPTFFKNLGKDRIPTREEEITHLHLFGCEIPAKPAKQMSKQSSVPTSRRGQNTAEYLVLLTLVTVMSIGIFTVFSKTIRSQLSNVVAAMTGNEGEYTSSDELGENATEAKRRADKKVNMGSFSSDEINYGD